MRDIRVEVRCESVLFEPFVVDFPLGFSLFMGEICKIYLFSSYYSCIRRENNIWQVLCALIILLVFLEKHKEEEDLLK